MAPLAVASEHIDEEIFTQTIAQTELNTKDHIIFSMFEVFSCIPNLLHGVR